MRIDAQNACPRSLPAKVVKHEAGMRRRISNARCKKLRQHLVVEYLKSKDARLVAAYEAYRRAGRPPVRKELERTAEALDPWTVCQEPVHVFLKMKPNGDHRAIQRFGLLNRSRHCLLKRALQASTTLHPNQYGSRGVPAAISQVLKAIKDGYVYCAEVDIKNCFSSFEREHLAKFLFLPKEVITYSLMGEHLNHVDGNLTNLFSTADDGSASPCTTDVFAEARQGLPTGSAASAMAAEVLLSWPFYQLPNNSVGIGYMDNTLLMAMSEDELNKSIKAFGRALNVHPVGSLTLKVRSFCKPGDPVVFLGHRMKAQNSRVIITPTDENRQKFHTDFQRGLKRLSAPNLTSFQRRKAFRCLRALVSSWCSNFSKCDDVTEFRSIKHAESASAYELALKKIAVSS